MRVRGAELLMAWLQFVGRIPWQVLVTLTFDPKRVYPVNRRRAEKEAERWCEDIARTLRSPHAAWVIAPERCANGQWHVHVLLVGIRDLPAFAHLWQLRNGKIDIRPVRDEAGAVLYTTKEAALLGRVSLSPALRHYRDRLSTFPTVLLYPDGSGATSAKRTSA